MFDVVFPICAAVTWVCFAAKLRDLRVDPSSPLLRVVCAQFAFVALAFTAATPSVYVRVDRITGVANLAILIVYTSVLLCSGCFQSMLLLWTYPAGEALNRARHRFVAYAVVITVLIGLFVVADVADGEHPIDFDVHFAVTPFATEFLILYYVAFAVVWVGAGRIGWRYASVAGRPWLVRGLRLMALGSVLALGYSAMKLAAVAASLIGKDAYALSVVWAPLSASAAALLIAAGITLPAWAHHPDAAVGTISRLRAYQELQPLWWAFYRQMPALVMDPPRSRWASRWAVRDTRHRLYRRVVEIEDGRLALRGCCDARVAEAAGELGHQAGLADADLPAIQEAAVLAAALRSRREGLSGPEKTWVLHSDTVDLAAQIGWLRQVARAFDRSPVVRALASPDPEPAPDPQIRKP